MTDLNPELIERAAKALWDEPGWDRASHEQRQHPREAAERALSAVLPNIIRQAKADALREAADDIERRINEPSLILLSDKYGGFHAGERHRAQHEVGFLRVRADRIEQGGQP